MRLAPTSYSPQSLQEHADQLVENLHIPPEAAAILVSEIRNALAPATMAVYAIEQNEHVSDLDPEDLSDLKCSHARIVALTTALCRSREAR